MPVKIRLSLKIPLEILELPNYPNQFQEDLEMCIRDRPAVEIAPPQRPELLTKLEPLTVALPIVVICLLYTSRCV